jgi:hypothetical protein
MEYDVAKFYNEVPSPVGVYRKDISEILHQDLHAFLGTSPSPQAKNRSLDWVYTALNIKIFFYLSAS